MKTGMLLLGSLLLVTLCAIAYAAEPTKAAPPANASPKVVSPEVHPDRTVTFRLYAPKAGEMKLGGEVPETPMKKDEQGVWSVTIGPLEPDIYSYKFVVDGVMVVDPMNSNIRIQRASPNSESANSLVEVTGAEKQYWEPQDVPHGTIHVHWYKSGTFNETRRLYLYTPPGYTKDTEKKYPVLYLLHGMGDGESSWTWAGRINLILDNSIAAGKAVPMIVVMPLGHVPQNTARTAVDDTMVRNWGLFGDELLKDVIPFTEKEYRVQADREHRALAGLSMGGAQTLVIGLNNLDTFSYIGGFGSAIHRANLDETFAKLVADPKSSNEKIKLLWLGCGNQDSLFEPNKNFDAFLTKAGINHKFTESGGGHTWLNWRDYFYAFTPLIFK